MKRRDFITKVGLGTAAVAGASLAAPAIAQEEERFLPVCPVGRETSQDLEFQLNV